MNMNINLDTVIAMARSNEGLVIGLIRLFDNDTLLKLREIAGIETSLIDQVLAERGVNTVGHKCDCDNCESDDIEDHLYDEDWINENFEGIDPDEDTYVDYVRVSPYDIFDAMRDNDTGTLEDAIEDINNMLTFISHKAAHFVDGDEGYGYDKVVEMEISTDYFNVDWSYDEVKMVLDDMLGVYVCDEAELVYDDDQEKVFIRKM